jgi:hypothetical protein
MRDFTPFHGGSKVAVLRLACREQKLGPADALSVLIRFAVIAAKITEIRPELTLLRS